MRRDISDKKKKKLKEFFFVFSNLENSILFPWISWKKLVYEFYFILSNLKKCL